MIRRRNTVSSTDYPELAAVTVVTALGAILSGANPTALGWANVVWLTAMSAALVWASATAPWWLLTATAIISAATTAATWWMLASVAAAAIASLVGWQRVSAPVLRAAAGGLILQGILRADVGERFGASALVSGIIVTALLVGGISRKPRPVRRRVMIVAASLAAIVVGAGIVGAATASGARPALTRGYDALDVGFDALADGRTIDAADAFDDAATELREAGSTLDRPWALPARVIPVLSQHLVGADRLSRTAAGAVDSMAATLRVTDLDALRVRQGAIDLVALMLLDEPLDELSSDISRLVDTVVAAESGWLVPGARRQIGRFLERSDDIERLTDAAAQLADIGPRLLGADTPRRYLIAFTSGAEARGLTGVMGNWVEVTVTDGRLRQTAVGRTDDLVVPLRTKPARLDMPTDFVDRYGVYGAADADGRVDPKFWSNVTMSPDGPAVGEAMVQMYAAATGRTLDGVVIFDPEGLAALVGATGPISVAGLDQPLTSETLADFLFRDQYQIEEAAREDLLDRVAVTAMQSLLFGELPPPQDLAALLRPAVRGGHIVAYTTDVEGQLLFQAVGLDGGLPDIDTGDGVAIVTNNAGGNKIDSFLSRTVTYRARVSPLADDQLRVDAALEVVLTNDAPTSGLPDYVIGNLVDAPHGTNVTLFSVYSPLSFTSATLDGQPLTLSVDAENGWNVYSATLTIDPGAARTVVINMVGNIAAPDGYDLTVRPQPLPNPDRIDVEVVADGKVVVGFNEVLVAATTFDANGRHTPR